MVRDAKRGQMMNTIYLPLFGYRILKLINGKWVTIADWNAYRDRYPRWEDLVEKSEDDKSMGGDL